jgi:hypothetical protein
MKRFVMTMVLTIALSSIAFAGQIPTDGIPAPAPSGLAQTATTTSPGQIPTVGVFEQLSSATVSALLTVLGLLSM